MKGMKKLKAFTVVLLIMQLVFGAVVTAYGDDEPIVDGAPNISITNGPVFDVDAGKSNEVKIEVRNLSPYGARNILVIPKINEIENNPLKVSVKGSDNSFSVLQPNFNKTLTFVVDVDKAAAASTYSVDVTFNCYNISGTAFQTKSTIYFKVSNALGTDSLSIDQAVIDPDSINPGETGKLNVTVKNSNNITLNNIEVAITDMNANEVSVSGPSIKKINALQGGLAQVVSFDILANGALEVGNYPLTINVKGKDANGLEHEATQVYYVTVGGNSSGKKSDVELRNVKEPSGTYGVNQNFTVAFDVFNKGDAAAKDLKITVSENGDGGNVVPKSNSVISIKELAAGESQNISVQMAATSNSESKNYSVKIEVEYTQNGKAVTYNQYVGVNISNPEKDDSTSKPKVIVSQYTSDPLIVMAGEEFDLTMTFLNTHEEKGVKNVKMYLTLSEETSSDTEKSGNIFTPVNSSNTFYFDSIPSKSTVNKQMRLFVVPEAQPKTYTLTVNFEYEDAQGNEYTATELLGINVKQSTKMETSEIYMPTDSEIYMPISLYFDVYNTGKVDVSNLKVELEGDIETNNKSTFIGNCAKGDIEYYEGSFSIINEGPNTVRMTISYDDPSGERIEEVTEYTINGYAPMPMDEFPEGDFMEPGMNGGGNMGGRFSSLSTLVKAGIGVGVLVVLAVGFIIFKKVRANKQAKFIEAEEDIDDDDEVITVAEEGNDVNEQL